MSSQLKTAITIDDSAIVDGLTIDAIDHTVPFDDVQAQLREGQLAVSAGDTHVKHLEDALGDTTGQIKLTKQNTGANESLAIGIDADGVTSGFVLTANGAGGTSWAASGGGGAQPVDLNGTAGEALAERDYVYLDESSGTWFKVDTDVTPIKCGRLRGIVNESGGISSAATGSIRLIGEVSGFTGLTAWTPVYASTTPGSYTQTRPSPTSGGAQIAVIMIGMAISTTNIVVLTGNPVQYMKRDTIADDGTLTIAHHVDEMAQLRRAAAYIGSSEAGAIVTQYASTNYDSDIALRDRTPATYGSDVCTGGTPSASSDSGGSFTASSAFDNNTSTQWVSVTNGIPATIQYTFGASRTIRQYKVYGSSTAASASPQDWTLEYWDGSAWQIADTVTGETGWGISEERTFTVSAPFASTQWRLNISDNNGLNQIAISEIEMMEADTFTDGADKLAQTFTLASSETIDSATLYLRKTGTPTGTLTIRIETTSVGEPTGTLADGNATVTYSEASLATSYADVVITFTGSFTLSAGTYAIVLSTDRGTSETNFVQWGADSSSPSFSGGEMYSELSSTYTAEGADAIFSITSPGTTFVEPAALGRWSGGTRDIAIRNDDGSGSNPNTNTTFKNVIGASADVTAVLEVP